MATCLIQIIIKIERDLYLICLYRLISCTPLGNAIEVYYEDIDQFQPQSSTSLYEEIINAEPCPAYACTIFNEASHSDEDTRVYEFVQP